MKIKLSQAFRNKLEDQVRYIARDKPIAARNFKKDLLKEIRAIPKMPFGYRKSIFFSDDTIRDLTFKGYVVIFRVNENTIEVFGLNKYQDKRIVE